jgi:hypothetical protein
MVIAMRHTRASPGIGPTTRVSAMRIILVLSLVALVAVAPIHSGETPEALALSRLKQHNARLAWSPNPIKVDIDCDGKQDYVFLAQDAESASVGVVLGRNTTSITVRRFGVSSSDQDELCAVPATIAPEPLDYDPTDAVGKLPGFARSKQCTAFVLSDGQCDPFHFFWNKKTGRLDWWRL